MPDGSSKPSADRPDTNWFPADEFELRDWGMRAAAALKDRFSRWLLPMIDPDKPALDQARLYKVCKDLCDEFEAALAPLTDRTEELKTKIVPAAFERDKAKTMTIEVPFDPHNNYRVTSTTKLRASIPAAKRDEAYTWLRDNKMGPLITESVNAETLSAAARAMADDNKELPEDIFTTYYQYGVSVTRVKK